MIGEKPQALGESYDYKPCLGLVRSLLAAYRSIAGFQSSRNIYPDIGDDFLKMLSTPGTYNFEEITKKAKVSNVISLPSVSSSLKTFVVNGDWQGQNALVLGKQKIAHVKVPSNGDWVYVY
uniref:Parasitic stage specific protein 1 n=2 Tax=Haemonchus contortus TaxID=6289 RepID=W6NBC7_HAECO